MLKKVLVFLAIATVIFLIACWVYLPSITRYRELKLEEEKINKKIQEIDAQIKALTDERSLLQSDIVYLEKVIREELGFVKPGEIVYELVTQKHPSNSPETAKTSASKTTVNVPVSPAKDSSLAGTSNETVSVRQSVAAIVSAQKSHSLKKKDS
ncbi:MAG TPA: septum formation initiator family protein [Candidatus Omnitrophota bacterium]|nr:septum formation initiator family protein [Candidatus Omnitrophota bacterium]